MAAVLVVGIFGTYFVMQGFDEASLASKTSAQMMGHVVVTAYDADGNIKAYRQSDNAIVVDGLNMLGALLFNSTSGLSAAAPVEMVHMPTLQRCNNSTLYCIFKMYRHKYWYFCQ